MIGRRRCRHQWTESTRSFTAPPNREFEVESCTREFAQMTAFGVTTVELKCVHCGDIAERRLIGKVGFDRIPRNTGQSGAAAI